MRVTLPAGRAALADAGAIVLFATIGLISHHRGLSASGYARDTLPLLGGWFAASLLFRLYADGGLVRLAATWATGVTAGVTLRAIVLGRTLNGKEAAFLVVALVTILVFVLALRLAVGLVPGGRLGDRALRPRS